MSETRELSCRDAMAETLAQAMAADPAIVVAGESLVSGGVFGCFAGLAERFGDDRVLDLPISEQAIVGLGIGSALAGLRPVVDLMFMDFLLVAMDQIANQAAKARFRFGGALSVPLTITATVGAGLGAGPQHSQSLEAAFCHVPGLKVVMPSNAHDTKGLLAAAIADDDPVLFLSHAQLLDRSSPCTDAIPEIALGSASTIRPGGDVTLVTYGPMVGEALRAASVLSAAGVDVEIVDLRSLQPFDNETVIASVKRTNHCVVVHEAVTFGGLGAEIAAQVQHAAFDYLDAPVARIGAPHAPPPYAPVLADAWSPDATAIVEQIRATLDHST